MILEQVFTIDWILVSICQVEVHTTADEGNSSLNVGIFKMLFERPNCCPLEKRMRTVYFISSLE